MRRRRPRGDRVPTPHRQPPLRVKAVAVAAAAAAAHCRVAAPAGSTPPPSPFPPHHGPLPGATSRFRQPTLAAASPRWAAFTPPLASVRVAAQRPRILPTATGRRPTLPAATSTDWRPLPTAARRPPPALQGSSPHPATGQARPRPGRPAHHRLPCGAHPRGPRRPRRASPCLPRRGFICDTWLRACHTPETCERPRQPVTPPRDPGRACDAGTSFIS